VGGDPEGFLQPHQVRHTGLDLMLCVVLVHDHEHFRPPVAMDAEVGEARPTDEASASFWLDSTAAAVWAPPPIRMARTATTAATPNLGDDDFIMPSAPHIMPTQQ